MPGWGTVTVHRVVEALIGRLITDEDFREEFLEGSEAVLDGLREHGLELTRTEREALVRSRPWLWAAAAEFLDPRLQKASLRGRRQPSPRQRG